MYNTHWLPLFQETLLTKLDKDRIYLAGHSFGACSTIHICNSKNPLLQNVFKAALLFDPWTEPTQPKDLENGIQSMPVMMQLSEQFERNKFRKLTDQLAKASKQCTFGVIHGPSSLKVILDQV